MTRRRLYAVPLLPPSRRGVDDSHMSAEGALGEWSTWMRSSGRSEKTIGCRVSTVRMLCARAGVDPLSATARQLAAALEDRAWSPGTLQTYHAQLRAFYRWAVRAGHRIDDPMLLLDRPRPVRYLPRPITNDELQAILGAELTAKTRLMVLLAAYAGLRASEIARIHGRDLDGDQLWVTGKGGKRAVVTLHAVILGAAAAMPRSGWWFPSPVRAGQPVRGNSVTITVARAMRAAGVNATAHRARHWNGSTQLRQGANIRVVQENMRHASLQSTQGYTEVDDAERRAAILALPVPLHVVRTPRRRRRPGTA